jgi:cobalt-precorrin-5B (C1)-methyltransferase
MSEGTIFTCSSRESSVGNHGAEGMRTGFTTGTCAAAAAKAATMLLCGERLPTEVQVPLPDRNRVTLAVENGHAGTDGAWAAVRKDAGDDPDVTDGSTILVSVAWSDAPTTTFVAGEGVGTVTKPGLSVPPGEPAINPVPRKMIREAVAEVTNRPVQVTVSIPGGRELAEKTFNPRLGIDGGLSILGTSGIVRPFSGAALRDALACALSVAKACKVTTPVFVPGRIGEKAARRHFCVAAEQLVEVSNEWGFILDEAAKASFHRLLIVGHPGKLAKLPNGDWDTHSSRSRSAVPAVEELARTILRRPCPESRTVEGIFTELPEAERSKLADSLAGKIRLAVEHRILGRFPVTVVLVSMRGDILGRDGETAAWRPTSTIEEDRRDAENAEVRGEI